MKSSVRSCSLTSVSTNFSPIFVACSNEGGSLGGAERERERGTLYWYCLLFSYLCELTAVVIARRQIRSCSGWGIRCLWYPLCHIIGILRTLCQWYSTHYNGHFIFRICVATTRFDGHRNVIRNIDNTFNPRGWRHCWYYQAGVNQSLRKTSYPFGHEFLGEGILLGSCLVMGRAGRKLINLNQENLNALQVVAMRLIINVKSIMNSLTRCISTEGYRKCRYDGPRGTGPAAEVFYILSLERNLKTKRKRLA